MNKKFSPIALVVIVLANINPVMAASKEANADLSTQKLDYHQNPNNTIVAGLFDDIIKTVEQIDETRHNFEQRELQRKQQEQAIKERQAREEERKRRQAELDAARKAATERQIQEAERRRQYFESLSPEQKQAYLQEQQALRQKQAEAGLFMADFLLRAFMSGDGGQSSSQQETWYYEKNPESTNNPAPAPDKPSTGFYGNCHHYGNCQ
ncbi:hypothetical protein [Nostoc sp. ChiVER01]|uniref:hypothetical protein n=1 Tax=Nostoc sp. ChiVER01 TaxID=3075382 RepID=UPI002AD49C5E|nr:hypothetical protein [Nostoc sp. ChiVER01]MDZ8226749.1 hypothetical protein [Nostoc sp. ChiVER01]